MLWHIYIYIRKKRNNTKKRIQKIQQQEPTGIQRQKKNDTNMDKDILPQSKVKQFYFKGILLLD